MRDRDVYIKGQKGRVEQDENGVLHITEPYDCSDPSCRHDAVRKVMGKWWCRHHADKLEAPSMGDIYG